MGHSMEDSNQNMVDFMEIPSIKIVHFAEIPLVGIHSLDLVAVLKTGWWLSHPFEKYEFVNWDEELPN